VASAPLPPLPNLGGGGSSQGQGQADPMAAILAQIAPVKHAVDGITSACKQIVQSGSIPGSEQICGQIIALAQGLIPMAAQNMFGGMGSGAAAGGSGGPPPPPGVGGAGGGSGIPMPPPPNGPMGM
jgi:hypothetical protein